MASCNEGLNKRAVDSESELYMQHEDRYQMNALQRQSVKMGEKSLGRSVQHRVALSDVTAQVSNKPVVSGVSKVEQLKESIGAVGSGRSRSKGVVGVEDNEIDQVQNFYIDNHSSDERGRYSGNEYRDLVAENSVIEVDGYDKDVHDVSACSTDIIDLDQRDIIDDNETASFENKSVCSDFQEHNDLDDDCIDDYGDTKNVEPLAPIFNDKISAILEHANKQCYKSTPDPMDDDSYDVVMVVELSDDIFSYLRKLEQSMKPDPYYMHKQSELKWSHRGTLFDWIVQVHSRFQLLPETLYLTVNLIDRFLSKETVTLSRFQLVGAAALFIAAKYEEINCPTLKDIVYMLDNAFTKEDVIKAEKFMIDVLEFKIGWPGPMSFLRRISKADDYEYDIRTLAKYLLEITIMDSRLVAAPPSWLAAGAYFLSNIILGHSDWNTQHVYYSGYTQEQIFPLATVMLESCRSAQTKHQAIWRKYSEKRQHRSAQVVHKWILLAEEKVQRDA